MSLIECYSNIAKRNNEKCWVCNNNGYIIVDSTIFYCDCCEGNIGSIVQNPISKFFNLEDLISENKFAAKYSARSSEG
jgi:hypothetical protein